MNKTDQMEHEVMASLEALKAVPMDREHEGMLEAVITKLKWHFAGLRASHKKGPKKRSRAWRDAAVARAKKKKGK